MTQPVRNIAIFNNVMQQNFLAQFAKHLKEKLGYRVHIYCRGPGQQRFYEKINGDGRFASINIWQFGIIPSDRQIDNPDEVIASANDWEKKLGCTYNEMMIVDRHLGRAFALGGFYHSRSKVSEERNYLAIVKSYNRRLSFWDEELKAKNINAVINGSRELVAVAISRGTPLRRLIRARYANFYYWAHNDKLNHPGIDECFRRLTGGDVYVGDPEASKSYVVGRNYFMKKNQGLTRVAYQLILRIAHQAYWIWSKSEKANEYYLSQDLMSRFRIWRELRKLTDGSGKKLEDLGDQPFVFFPLQTEPEFSLNWQSPEYFFQLPTIAQISRDLPAGVLLVVKETYFAVGRRPANFYDQIRDFKNVVLLDLTEPGVEVIKKAKVTVTITGSAGHEAAIMGKPVISFGRHNPYNIMPHVKVVTDGADLKGYLHEFLSDEFNEQDAAAVGQQYLAATLDVAFDMLDFSYIEITGAQDEAIENACNKFVSSLDGDVEMAQVS